MANYVTFTTNQMKKYLLNLYKEYGKKADFSAAFCTMLWGQPGIGKSELVMEFAEELGKITGKEVRVRIISLLLMMPTDLRGIPAKVTDENGEDVARWLSPEIFKLDKSDKVLNILFFDELSAAPQTVQAAAYQITNERHIGEHYLPDNALVIAAGNRVTDQSVAYKMPKALGNRLLHFEVVASVNDWKEWAYEVGIDPRIISFVSWKPDYLNSFDPSNDDVAFATPRSWTNASKILKNMDFETAYPAVAGMVGLGIATEFKAYIKIYMKLPKFADIASGKLTKIPAEAQKSPAMKYALCSMIVSNMKALASGKDSQKDKIAKAENIGKFLLSFKDKEYQALAMGDTYKIMRDVVKEILMTCPSWISMLKETGGLLLDQ